MKREFKFGRGYVVDETKELLGGMTPSHSLTYTAGLTTTTTLSITMSVDLPHLIGINMTTFVSCDRLTSVILPNLPQI